MRGGNGLMWGGLGLKSLNPSPPHPALWCGAKILPHPRPTTFAGLGKPAWGEAKRGGSSGAGQNCHPYAQLTVTTRKSSSHCHSHSPSLAFSLFRWRRSPPSHQKFNRNGKSPIFVWVNSRLISALMISSPSIGDLHLQFRITRFTCHYMTKSRL